MKKGNQWEVSYPWMKSASELPDNINQAEMKLMSLEKNLMKKPVQAKMYNEQMEQMLEMNFARKSLRKI